MAEPNDWFSANAPTAAPAQGGGDWFGTNAPTPTFSSTNEKDASGDAVVDRVSNAWDWANTPLVPQIAQAAHAIAAHIDAPRLDQSKTLAQIKGFLAGSTEAAGTAAAGFTSPLGLALTLAGFGEESALAKQMPALRSLLSLPAVQKLQKAVQAVGGAGFVARGAERTYNAPDAAGKLQGLAEMATGALGATSAMREGGARVVSEPRLTAPEQASNAFAAERGIPLDAATATGSKFVRGVQKVSGESLLGSPTAERAQQAQAAALTRVGGELADEAHPSPITAEQAGGNTVASIRGLIGDLNTSATDAYGRLREIEADPKHAQRINTAPEGSSRYNQISAKLAAGSETGQAPHRLELLEMRRIEAELDNQRFEQRSWNWRDSGPRTGNAAGGHADIAPGAPNAAVYQELKGFAPSATGEEMRRAIQQTLATGEWNSVSRGAFEIARDRLNKGLTGPDLLAPNTAPLGRTETVNLPVYLDPAKKALAPLRDRLMREKELTGVLMGDKARALVALDALVSGPSHAPISIVDAALGDLKAMARADVPELRTQGQGLAAAAVKQLDAQVRATAAKAGPEALQALEEGRAATVAKHQIAEVFGDVAGKGGDAEPVSIVRKLTAPKDSAVSLLRRVREAAPTAMPEIARAKLEDLLGQATERGRFDHADKLYAEWQKLGGETKQILFPQPGQRAALDHFFLLAKRIAENPNSSGTAPTLVKTGEAVGLLTHPLATLPPTLSMGAISKLLYSPRGVRALTYFMASAPKVATSSQTLRTAAQTAGWAEVVAAARAAGVPLALPQAAGNTTTGAPER